MYQDELHTTTTLPPNFSPDSDTQSGQAALPITRASLIPSEYTAKTPTVRSSSPHALLVPLVGLLLAVGLVAGGQVIGDWFPSSQISPDTFSIARAYSVVVAPTTFLAQTTIDTARVVGDSLVQVSAVALVFPAEVGSTFVGAITNASDTAFYYPTWLVERIQQKTLAFLATPVANVEIPASLESVTPAVSSIAAIGSLENVGTAIAEIVNRTLTTISTWVTYYVDRIGTNWRQFLLGEEAVAQPTTVDVASDELLREQIKNEVIAELQASINEALQDRGGVITETKAGQGVVVVPSTGSATDAALKAQIQNLFSDPVLVEFDDSRQTGVITPVFNNTTGENYIFVLTPIQY